MKHIIIPFIDLAEMTIGAAEDALRQGDVDQVTVILADNGSSPHEMDKVQAWQSATWDRINNTWWRDAPGTLDDVWNMALRFCWDLGATEALVMNNDSRIHPETYNRLHSVMFFSNALMVTAVNVGEVPAELPSGEALQLSPRGGPDYSCFLISRECHEKYPFDPAFTYLGDLDHHRRIMLGGDGHRIFSVPVGYHHLASQTIKHSPIAAARHAIENPKHQAEYFAKWGGPANEEVYWEAYAPSTDPTRYTKTPDLQHKGLWRK